MPTIFPENKHNTETVGLTNTNARYRESNRDYFRKLGRDNHQLFGIAKSYFILKAGVKSG